MAQTTVTESPFARRLRLIHERMTGVPEEEVELALLLAKAEMTELTMGATDVTELPPVSLERRRRSASALTRTA
jgi:hypothetical protein